MKRPYWKRFTRFDPETTPMHEALHAAASFAVSGECYFIKLYANGEGKARAVAYLGWKHIAIFLAPALIDDISFGDEDWLERVNPHTRGYAWGWLKKNKRKIMRMAKQICAEMGEKPGILRWRVPWEMHTMYWQSTRRKR